MIKLIQNGLSVYDGTGGFTQTPIGAAFGVNVRSGDTIVVCIHSFKWTCDGIADTQGNIYVQAKSTTNGGAFADYADIWYAENVKGGPCTVTPHFIDVDGSDHVTDVEISEWTGIKRATALGPVNGATGTGTAVSPGSVTPGVDGALIIGVGCNYNGNDDTVAYNTGGGYTKLDEQLGNGAVYTRFYSEYLIQTSNAATTASYTLGNSSDWQTSVAVFLPSTSPDVKTLTDDFNDNSTDVAKWTKYQANGGVLTETNGQLEYQLAANTSGSWAGYTSVGKYSLIGSNSVFKFGANTTGNSWLDMTLSLEALPVVNNFVSVGLDVGTQLLEAVQEINGTDTVLYSTAFNPAVHVYGRLLELNDVLYFQYSTDGITNWTTYYQMTPPINLTDVYVVLDDFEYDSASSPGLHILDGYNITPSGLHVGSLLSMFR